MSFRTRLRPAKRALAFMIEPLWRGAFSVMGNLRGSRARAWESPGQQQVLVLAPHPDDEAIGCGGTVLRHVAAGDRVTIAIATDGRRSGAMADPDAMATCRHGEAIDAAAQLRVSDLRWLGLPEGDWPVAALRDALRDLLTSLRPDIVYAPSRVDFHPEHHKVAHALALALETAAPAHRTTTLRVYQIQVPLTSVLVNVVSDLTPVLAQSEAALRAHASQSGSVECAFRRRRYSARIHGLAGSAEEFWDMTAQSYIGMHRDPPSVWQDSYRGLRNFPATDPLAWMIGQGARRKLLGVQAATSA